MSNPSDSNTGNDGGAGAATGSSAAVSDSANNAPAKKSFKEEAKEVEQRFSHAISNLGHWWRTSVINTVDQTDVIAKRRDDAELSARYILMLMMAAGIAMLGLLQNSSAVIIGAMLISPLMGPIMGGGFSLAVGDFSWLKDSMRTLLIGAVLSILFCALIVLISPLKPLTDQIVARTKPNLVDLVVALFSAVAGTYAMIRGRENSIVGVAIATALMPPLSVVGYGLATWNSTIFWGALLLFVTNFMTIGLTSWAMARLYGFRTRLSQKQTQIQTIVVLVVLVALMIPLGISLSQIVKESRNTAEINQTVSDAAGSSSRVYQLNIDWNADPVVITATIGVSQVDPEMEGNLQDALQKELSFPVVLQLNQVQTDTTSSASERAQLSANQRQQEARNRLRIQELTDGLALIGGVQPSQVSVDTEKKWAVVRSHILAGAGMATYRQLESRIAKAMSDWTVHVIPPAVVLPEVSFSGREPTEAGEQAIATIAWASRRRDTPVLLSGPTAAVENVRRRLAEQGIRAEVGDEGGNGTEVRASWAPPTQSGPVIDPSPTPTPSSSATAN